MPPDSRLSASTPTEPFEALRQHVEATSLRRRMQLDHLRRFAAEASQPVTVPPDRSPTPMMRGTIPTEATRPSARVDPPWVRWKP